MNGKKLVRGTILTALCMAVMLWVNGTVSEAFWVVVKSDNTRVRDAAGTDSEVMTAVNAGDSLNVVSEEQGSDGNTWYKVSINNVSGYVRADTVEMAPEGGTDAAATTAATEQAAAAVQPVEASSSSVVEPMATQAATVKKDDVNVRASASTNGNVVAKLQSGAAVTLTGTTSDNSGKTWYQVNFINNGSNVTGFIREDFVEPGEIMEPQISSEDAPAEGDGELADIYGDMPAEEETANNDYGLFYELDTEGGSYYWYVHDNIIEKRYKLEQLLQADEMNTHNLEIKNTEIGRLKIVLIVLAVLLVIALAAAAFFGFKYHDLKDGDGDEDDDEDDEEDDYRARASARRRVREEAEPGTRRREAVRDEERAPRGSAGRAGAGAARRPATGQRRPAREEAGVRSTQAGRKRPEAETPGRQSAGAARARSEKPASQTRRPAAPEREAVRRTGGRSDVEWKSKNFLANEDGLDFSFIDGDDEE